MKRKDVIKWLERDASPPHGGVWIETRAVATRDSGSCVTPSRGGVD